MAQRKPVGRKFGAFWGVFAFVCVATATLVLASFLGWAKPEMLRALGTALTPLLTLLGGTYLAAAGGNVGEHFATRRRSLRDKATVVEEAPPPAPDADALVAPDGPS